MRTEPVHLDERRNAIATRTDRGAGKARAARRSVAEEGKRAMKRRCDSAPDRSPMKLQSTTQG